MIESAFFAALSAPVPIQAIVAGRIYALILPDEVTLPAIDYSFIAASTAPTNDTTGPRRYLVEVNCWGASYTDAVTLRHAVITALDGYSDADMQVRLSQPRDFFAPERMSFRAMAEFHLYSNL